ncbi:MAG: YwaF family protein [Planctomycetota bacterium]|jgi:hypothetical integral membrane protein (TIGR02206 family)
MEWLWSENRFVLFGAAHLGAFVVLGLSTAALVWAGRRLRGSNGQTWLSRGLALSIVLCQGTMQIEVLLPAHFLLDDSLPLEVCDLAWVLAVYALWTHKPWAFGLVYYWGLTMTLLAMITPNLVEGFPHLRFLMFYYGHGVVVLAAAYMAWGVGLRPTWRLYRLALAVTAAYAFVLYFVNRLLGTNYMNLTGKPPKPTMLDYLGPYPFYMVVVVALGFTVWAAMTWPWQPNKPPERVCE